ncbi:MAG: IS3 family transposase, partial [Oscillospiraceae bacterium]
ADTGIPRSTIYAWIKQTADSQLDINKVSAKNFRLLETKVARLEGIIEILQNVNCRVNDPLDVKLYALEELYGQYSIHMLCEALKVSRGTFYNHMLRNKRDNTWYAKRKEDLRLKIQQVYDDSNQIFGAAKIAAVLKEDGCRVSVEMVRQLMQDIGITSIRQNAKKLYDKEQRYHKNYLNQQFTTVQPNEVWVSDVTYFRYDDKNYYICAILDLYARTVVGYRVGKVNSTQLVKSTFRMAYEERQPVLPLMFHTDRGANYRSKTFCTYLKSLEVTQSYSRAHVPYDNSVMESFFSSLKREELYRTKYRSENEFRTAVENYMTFYNERRPHAKNGYKTPMKKELDYYNNQAAL